LDHVAVLRERGGVGEGERDLQNLGQGLREEGLAGAGGADQEDVGLLQLDVTALRAGLDALVVVVHGHGEDLLRAILPDHILVEHGLDLRGLGEGADLPALLLLPLLRDDVVAELDALVADVDGGAGDELADVVLALAAERALQRSAALALAGHALTSGRLRGRQPCRSRDEGSAWRRSPRRRSGIPWPARRSWRRSGRRAAGSR